MDVEDQYYVLIPKHYEASNIPTVRVPIFITLTSHMPLENV